MQLIKIYNKDYSPLTLFTEKEFSELRYRKTLNKIGDCDFIIRLDREKVTTENLEHYNRLEILEDGVVKFVGVIVQKTINIDTALIRCRELTHVLKKRILDTDYTVNGAVTNEVKALLADINNEDDTGVSAGDVAGAIGTVNSTYNRSTALDILSDIVEISGNQYRLENDRTLTVKPQIGEDLSESVIFQYDISRVASSNILQFDVDDSGDNIATKVYGQSGAYSSTKEDAALIARYGVLEKYRDFRVANTQNVLDDFTEVEIADKIFSPEIQLNPKVLDNFDVGDRIRLVIKNALISIDETYQVLEKRVSYNGTQKEITVNINSLSEDLATKLLDRDKRLNLLENQV